MEFLAFSQTKLGSSLSFPANAFGGSRAISFLVAHFALQNTASNPAEKNRAKPEKQKGKKEGGWGGEGIFALLRFRLEYFRFSLIKRNTKQKIFHLLLKDKVNCEARESALGRKNGGRKNKKCNEKISVLVRRSEAEAIGNAPTELPRSTSVKLSSEPPRAPRVISRGGVYSPWEDSKTLKL